MSSYPSLAAHTCVTHVLQACFLRLHSSRMFLSRRCTPKKKCPIWGAVSGFLVPPPETKKKSYKCNGQLFECPETVFDVRENYASVLKPFPASGKIIWTSGNRFWPPGQLFERSETASGVRENYLTVREPFPASGEII